VEFKPFVFPPHPAYENAVKYTEDAVKRRFVVLPVVIYPTSKNGITDMRQICKALVTAPVETPASHLAMHLFSSLTTHRRAETNKAVPRPTLCFSRAERIPKEHKGLVWITTSPFLILAIDDLCLFGMKLQLAL